MKLLKTIAGGIGFIALYFLGKWMFKEETKRQKDNFEGATEGGNFYDFSPFRKDAVKEAQEIIDKEFKI